MQPGLTISRPTAGWDIRVDTLGAERFGEVGWAKKEKKNEKEKKVFSLCTICANNLPQTSQF